MAKPEPTKKIRTRRKKTFTNIASGVVHILATFNNTVISITDKKGNVIVWATPGTVGFVGSKRSTPFAAQIAAESAAKKAKELGMQEVDIRVKGPGSGRDSAIRAIQAAGLTIKTIKDVTPMPHNGCRPPKRRRV